MTTLLRQVLVALLLITAVYAFEEGACSLADDSTCQPQASQADIDCSQKEELTIIEKAHKFHDFLKHMFNSLEAHAATLSQPDLQAQEENILVTWLEYFSMDTSVLTQVPVDTNWLYELYTSTKAIAPPQFWKTWDERAKPSREEIRILLNVDESALDDAVQPDGSIDEDTLMNHLFVPFRQRGFTFNLLDTFCRTILGPLKTIAYAIPSPANLELIARFEPLIEVGAGTGYWSANLQRLGIDVAPYDADPPEEGKKGMYFDRTYTKVEPQTCQSVFQTKDTNNNNRTLLMIWPNNPDNMDNAPEFHSDRLPPVWDIDCLQAFVQAGGTTVILVAERQANIHVLPHHPQNPTQPDSGFCASRAFQTKLEKDFELIHQMPIPTWYYSDDLTVWRLKL